MGILLARRGAVAAARSAPPQFVGVDGDSRIGSGSVNVTPPLDAQLWLAAMCINAFDTISVPSGWSLLDSWAQDEWQDHYRLYWATTLPGSSWAFTGSSGSSGMSIIVAGYSAATPVVSAAFSETSPSASAPAPALVARIIWDMPDANEDPTYPSAATIGRRIVRQATPSGWPITVAIAHQEVSPGAIAPAAWVMPEPYVPVAATIVLTN